jgi:cytochrome c oxidase cbb3-type subunit III
MSKDKIKEGELLEHDYDGIQELDNPLPNWWLATFYGAILFSVLYVGYYHFGPGPSLDDELSADLAQVKAQEAAGKKAAPPISESELAAVYADPGKRAQGKQVFTEKCMACHGAVGEGQIGPNLTDAYWLHGSGALSSLMKVVSEGVPEKGMPPWEALLKPEELLAVVAHVKSLQGTKPAKAKPPQGELVKQ